MMDQTILVHSNIKMDIEIKTTKTRNKEEISNLRSKKALRTRLIAIKTTNMTLTSMKSNKITIKTDSTIPNITMEVDKSLTISIAIVFLWMNQFHSKRLTKQIITKSSSPVTMMREMPSSIEMFPTISSKIITTLKFMVMF